MGVVIRRAAAEDAAALATLNRLVQVMHVKAEPTYFNACYHGEQTEDFFRKLLFANSVIILIALADDYPIGYVWFEMQDRPGNTFKSALRRAYVHHIAVCESARGKGVGSSLLRAVEVEAVAQGITHVAVDTWAFNDDAQAFFQRLGFEPFNIAMRKHLAGSA